MPQKQISEHRPPQPKRHHYVPRFYLEGFVDPAYEVKGQSALWVYERGKRPRKSSPSKAAVERYFYAHEQDGDRSVAAEHAIQKLEDEALPVLRHIRKGTLNITAQERAIFSGFMALMVTRVPRFRIFTDREARRLLEHLKSLLHEPGGLEAWVEQHEREHDRKLIGGAEQLRSEVESGSCYDEAHAPRVRLGVMFQQAMELSPRFYQTTWTLLQAREGEFFVTSDDPVFLDDPQARPGSRVGFASSPTVEYMFPLDRQFCLLCHNRAGGTVELLAPATVRNVNKRVIAGATRQVYAATHSEKLRTVVDGMLARREPGRRGADNGP